MTEGEKNHKLTTQLAEEYYNLAYSLESDFKKYLQQYQIPLSIKETANEHARIKADKRKEMQLRRELDDFAKFKGYEHFGSFSEKSEYENLIGIYFAKVLHSHQSLIMLINAAKGLDADIIARSGIEAMAKLYTIVQDPDFHKILYFNVESKNLFNATGRAQENNTEEINNLKEKIKYIMNKNRRIYEEKIKNNQAFYEDRGIKNVNDLMNSSTKFAVENLQHALGFNEEPRKHIVNFIFNSSVHSSPDHISRRIGSYNGSFYEFNGFQDKTLTKELTLIIYWLFCLERIIRTIINKIISDMERKRGLLKLIDKLCSRHQTMNSILEDFMSAQNSNSVEELRTHEGIRNYEL